MSSTTWHVPRVLLDDYRAGRLDAARVMSVDAHLQRCAQCRAGLVVYGRRRYLDPGEPRWNPLSGFAR